MFRKYLIALVLSLAALPAIAADPDLSNFRFGIIRSAQDGVYEFVAETTRIPRRYKDTGFRFGVGFENPKGATIEWYEIIHLPADMRQVSGDLQRTNSRTLRSKTTRSNQTSVVDDYWFDEGDPLGKHKLELFVNGVRRFSVDFEVVEDK